MESKTIKGREIIFPAENLLGSYRREQVYKLWKNSDGSWTVIFPSIGYEHSTITLPKALINAIIEGEK